MTEAKKVKFQERNIKIMKDLSNENVIHIAKDGVQYLQFRRLLEYSDILVHAYSLGIDKNFRTARAKNVEPLTQEEVKKLIKTIQIYVMLLK